MLIIDNITKEYINGKGIRNVSFSIKDGCVFSLIGPNGSGKSTTIKIIAGVLTPQIGNVLLYGLNTESVEAKVNIGYLPEDPFLYPNLSAVQFLNFVASMKGIMIKDEIENWLKTFELWDSRYQSIGTFSFGMKKKVALISAIIGKPKLLILDEPTNGLDTKSLIHLKRIINEFKNNGSIVLICSHVLEFIEKLVDQVAFIKQGTLIKVVDIHNETNLDSVYNNIYL